MGPIRPENAAAGTSDAGTESSNVAAQRCVVVTVARSHRLMPYGELARGTERRHAEESRCWSGMVFASTYSFSRTLKDGYIVGSQLSVEEFAAMVRVHSS